MSTMRAMAFDALCFAVAPIVATSTILPVGAIVAGIARSGWAGRG